MTTTTSKRDSVGQESQLVGIYLALTLGAGFLVIWCVSEARIMPAPAVLLIALVALGGMFWTWTPAVLLALLGVVLYDVPNHWLGVLPAFRGSLSLAELFLAASFLLYASMVFRFAQVRAENTRHALDAPDWTTAVGDALVYLAVGFVLATIARTAFPVLFLGRTMSATFRMHPILLGVLVALVLIAFGSWVVTSVVRAIGRWGMTESEARLVLQDQLYRDLRPDIRRSARTKARHPDSDHH